MRLLADGTSRALLIGASLAMVVFMTRRSLRPKLALIALLAVSAAAAEVRPRGLPQGEQLLQIAPAETPYTSILQETLVAADGSRRLGARVTYAVRSDGSLVQRIEGVPRTGRILHLASGVRIETNERFELKSTTKLDKDPGEWRRTPHSLCVGNSFGKRAGSDNEVLQGREFLGSHYAAKIADRAATWWYSLEVGCAPLAMQAQSRNGPRSERQLVRLLAGEPDAALFTVPRAFMESPPSKLLPPITADCRGRCLELADTARRLMDEQYLARRMK